MARSLSRTLALSRLPSKSALPSIASPNPTLSSSAISCRYRSIHTPKVQLIELDLDSASRDGEVLGIKKLEDAIHSIIVQRAAPAWLPFRPGFSYWVPPKPRAGSIIELVGKLSKPLSEDETLAFSSACGWPSSNYFLKGDTYGHPIPAEAEVKVHTQLSADEASESEDEK